MGKKIYSEEITRLRLMNTARQLGCSHELQKIFDKTDDLLRRCTNAQERQQIAIFGATEIDVLFGKGPGTLEIDGIKIR